MARARAAEASAPPPGWRPKVAGPVGKTAECCSSVLTSPVTSEEAAELARVLGALADPVRLRLFSLVAARGEVCSCELEAPLGKSQPTISHHTRVLAQAGLIVGEKRGRWVWWSIVPERLTALRKALGE